MTIAKVVVTPTYRVARVTQQGKQVVRVSRLGARGPAGTNHPIQLSLSIVGRPQGAPNNVLARYSPPQDATVEAALMRGYAETPPDVSSTIKMVRVSDGAEVFRAVWGVGENEPTFTVTITTILATERYRFEGDASVDASVADLDLTACFTRVE